MTVQKKAGKSVGRLADRQRRLLKRQKAHWWYREKASRPQEGKVTTDIEYAGNKKNTIDRLPENHR
jgi:hypothetical protein